MKARDYFISFRGKATTKNGGKGEKKRKIEIRIERKHCCLLLIQSGSCKLLPVINSFSNFYFDVGNVN